MELWCHGSSSSTNPFERLFVAAKRPLTPKKTSFNVEIFRLGMPTIHNNGEKISGRAIRFVRTNKPNQFDFEVDDLNGPRYSSWVKECNAHGHLGNTSGGRTFGYAF